MAQMANSSFEFRGSILLVSLLAILALTNAHSADMIFALQKIADRLDVHHTRARTQYIGSFASAKENVIQLGAIEDPKNAYLRLQLEFRVDDTDQYATIFRTDENGIQVQISNSAARITVGKPGTPGYRTLMLSNTLTNGTWHVLDVEAFSRLFIHAHVDNEANISIASDDLAFKTGDIKVGTAIDDPQSFHGELRDATVVLGNLLGEKLGRLLFYGLQLSLLAAAIASTLYAVRRNAPLRQFVVKVVVIALPLIVVVGYLEFRLSGINTGYYLKRVFLEQELSRTEVLTLGSSNAYYGIDPGRFRYPGFNLAFLGQSMYYDEELALKFVPRMPRLKVVVLPAIYFTIGTDHSRFSTFSQAWRQNFYRQYFDLPVETSAEEFLDWTFWLDPNKFSKIAMYGGQVRDYVRNDFSNVVDLIPMPSGWYSSADPGPNLNDNVGPKAAEAHNITTDPALYDKNLKYWEELIVRLQQNGITAVIVQTPTHASYHEHLDPTKVALIKQKLQALAEKYNLKYRDYTDDPRFSLDDYISSVDHLNTKGAVKFSKILDEELIAPAVSDQRHLVCSRSADALC
jgi:hypothetical protein